MDSTSSPVLAWIDDIVWEIVVRLPPKSLMRFKLVSKHWNKIISDPSFVKSYIGGFCGLLITKGTRDTDGYSTIEGFGNRCFPHTDSFLGDKYQQQYCDYEVTNIENGLCVFYEPKPRPGGAFTLCNIATNELLDLPIKSPEEVRYVYEDETAESYLREYYLGFEPVRGVYKLVRHFYDDERHYLQICTLGGGEDKELYWRSIDEGTLMFVSTENICINGILYLKSWISENYSNNFFVQALNLSTETAQSVPLPDGLSLLSPGFSEASELIQLGGDLGLIHLTHEMSTIWILKDNETWEKSQSVDLMRVCRIAKCESANLTGICGFDITYLGNLPTGEVLLASARVTKDDPVLTVYKYDHIQNKLSNWTKIDNLIIGNIVSICYQEDNIVALNSLITISNGFSTTSKLNSS